MKVYLKHFTGRILIVLLILIFTSSASLSDEVKEKILSLHGTKDVEVELVWEPQWNQDMMSDAAKLQLGLY